MFETPKNYHPFTIPKGELSKRWLRPLTKEEETELGIGEAKEPKKSSQGIGPLLETNFQNPETGNEQEIEINFEEKILELRKFYKDKFNLEIDETEIRDIWVKNYAEIKGEIEKYGYDSILIIPDNLPGEAEVNQRAVETMDEGAGKGKVAATKYWTKQQDISSVGKSKCRIILVHSDQNIYNNPDANPYLKATLGKNIMGLTGLDPAEAEKRINGGQELPTNFETKINGKKKQIQAEGLSLKEYEIFQRIYFEKTSKHLDESGWIWLTKSRSGSRVVNSYWYPDARRLDVGADDPSNADAHLGLRLSRSFSN